MPNTPLSFIWYFLKEYKHVVAIHIFLALIAGLWGPLHGILIKNIINLLPNAHKDNLSILFLPASLIIVNFIVFDNITWRLLAYIRAKFIPIVINNIIASLTDKVLSKSSQFYQDNLSGKLSKQITNLADGIERTISTSSPMFLRAFSLLLNSMIAAYFANPIF